MVRIVKNFVRQYESGVSLQQNAFIQDKVPALEVEKIEFMSSSPPVLFPSGKKSESMPR
jgi:hypothetical protein